MYIWNLIFKRFIIVMNDSSQDPQKLHKLLQDSNLQLTQIRVHSNRSFMICVEDFSIRVRKFIRQRHLDIIIPSLIVASAFGFTIFFMINAKEQEKKCYYDLGGNVSAVIGVGVGILSAINTFHDQYHYKKLVKASDYIKLWHSEHITKLDINRGKIVKEVFYDKHPIEFDPILFNQSHNPLTEFKKTPDGVEILKKVQYEILERLTKHSTEEEDIVRLLNFFEYMGQDIKLDVVDSNYLKDYFYSVVVSLYECFRKYIEYNQFDVCNRLKFCNFIYLAQRWEKEGDPPEIPEICKRPLIITSDDITTIKKIKEKIQEEKRFLRIFYGN